MDSNISLIKKSSAKSPPRYSHAYPSFFSTHTTSPLFHNRLALVQKIGRFLEDAIEKCYFDYWLDDVLDTPFCIEATQEPKAYVEPFILRIIDVIDKRHAIDDILIYMLIYIELYFNLHKNDWLHRANFKLMLVHSAWLATKILEDDPNDFTKWVSLTGLDKRKFKELEVFFLSSISWDTYITESRYKNFCHALSTYQPQLDFQTMDEDELRGLAFI